MERAAILLKVQAGREAAYRDWVQHGPISELEQIYARNGVVAKTVLMAGTTVIAHYEAKRKEDVLKAYADPAATAMLTGELRDLLALDPDTPLALFEEIFAWQVPPPPGPVERAGLHIRLQPGKEAAYREWVGGAVDELVPLWNRNEIYRHDVLLSGSSLIAFYECRSKLNVLKVFREPEAMAMLMGPLAQLFALDPYTPFSLFEEVFSWRERA